ncbi:MAG: hypothetical protein AAF658_19055, partial [Myxococcota bacterium]
MSVTAIRVNDVTVTIEGRDSPPGWELKRGQASDLRQNEKKVAQYEAEIQNDLMAYEALTEKLERDLASSGFSEDQIANFSALVKDARRNARTASREFNQSVDALRELRENADDGLSKLDRGALEALIAVQGSDAVTPELQAQLEALPDTDPAYQAWMELRVATEQAAVRVLDGRALVVAARAELDRLEGAEGLAEDIQQTLRGLEAIIGETNDDIANLRDWRAEQVDDLQVFAARFE